MQTGDDILFTAPGPDPIPTATTEIVGTPGNSLNVYWIVSHFPIGSVVSGPFPQKSSPDLLDEENYVLISWLPTPGASSYDLLFTKELKLPRQPGRFLLAANLTQTSFRDRGDVLLEYDLAGVPLGTPQEEHIYFNNRDFKQPTVQFIPWPIQVSSIIFEDGSSQNTAGGGGLPAPPDQSVQVNNNGAFYGTQNLTWDIVNSRLGIGTQNPQTALDVAGGIICLFDLYVNGGNGIFVPNGSITAGGSIRAGGRITGNFISTYNTPASLKIVTYDDGFNAHGIGLGGNNQLTFGAYIDPEFGTPQMVLDSQGRLGIGTQDPQAALDVRGSALMVVPTASNMEVWNGNNLTLEVSDTGVVIDQISVPYALRVLGSIRMGGGGGNTELFVNSSGTVEIWNASNPSQPIFQVAANGDVNIIGRLFVNGVQVP